MKRLEVSGAVRPIYGSLGVKRLSKSALLCHFGIQGHTAEMRRRWKGNIEKTGLNWFSTRVLKFVRSAIGILFSLKRFLERSVCYTACILLGRKLGHPAINCEREGQNPARSYCTRLPRDSLVSLLFLRTCVDHIRAPYTLKLTF